MFRQLVIAGALMVGFATPALFAQVIYEPVQYQYTTERGRTFYYGGDNPRLIARLEQSKCLPWRLRTFGYLPRPAPVKPFVASRPFDVTPVVVGDCGLDGNGPYTIADAMNEAYANVPTYFRKRDLLPMPAERPQAATVDHKDAAGGSIEIRQYEARPIAAPFDGQAKSTSHAADMRITATAQTTATTKNH